MKPYTIMYVNGHPVGKWKINKSGSVFRNRKWRFFINAQNLAIQWYKLDGSVCIVQEWLGDELIKSVEYSDKWMKPELRAWASVGV